MYKQRIKYVKLLFLLFIIIIYNDYGLPLLDNKLCHYLGNAQLVFIIFH